jgi:hypothetical protein
MSQSVALPRATAGDFRAFGFQKITFVAHRKKPKNPFPPLTEEAF